MMGSIFSPRWADFDNQLFFSSPYSMQEEPCGSSPSFINSFSSNVIKDLGE
jgi:hypothetical protein